MERTRSPVGLSTLLVRWADSVLAPIHRVLRHAPRDGRACFVACLKRPARGLDGSGSPGPITAAPVGY